LIIEVKSKCGSCLCLPRSGTDVCCTVRVGVGVSDSLRLDGCGEAGSGTQRHAERVQLVTGGGANSSSQRPRRQIGGSCGVLRSPAARHPHITRTRTRPVTPMKNPQTDPSTSCPSRITARSVLVARRRSGVTARACGCGICCTRPPHTRGQQRGRKIDGERRGRQSGRKRSVAHLRGHATAHGNPPPCVGLSPLNAIFFAAGGVVVAV